MRTIQQIKEHATYSDARIWSDEVAISCDELQYLIEIAEQAEKDKRHHCDLCTCPTCAARDAGLFGED